MEYNDRYLIVTFTKELEPLSFLVHKNAVEMAAFDASDLDRLVAPSHDLARADVSDARRHFAPLKDHRLGYSTVGIHVNALVVVAQ